MAISNDNVSWSRVQSTKGHCMPDRGSLPEPVPGNIYFIPGILCSSQIIPSNFRSDGFMHRLGTTWETTHAAHPVVSSMPLVSEKGQYFSPCSGQESTFTTPTVVDSKVQHFQGSMSRPDTSTGNNMDRCLQSGLGCSSGHSEYFRDLVPNTDIRAHQCSRDVSGSECLVSFREIFEGKTVLIRSDNSTVVCYINRQGGTKSPQLCMIVWNIFQWCLNRNISILAAHIPGKKNSLADSLSRGNVKVKVTEWSLNRSVAETLFNIYTKPNIDLFVTKEDRKIQTFCSPYPDPEAWSCDALACNWTGMYAYAFPPPILIPRILQKVKVESCVLLLVAPLFTETIVVSNTSQSFDRHANTSTKHRVSTDSKKRSGKTSRSAKPKVSSMENIRRYKATEKFSERAKTFITNSKRESTRKGYDARLTIYRNWCSARSVSPHSISVSDLAEFFIYLHDVRNC